MGIQITIEDFGTGHSLSYLRRIPVDTIKIDRSLVDEMTQKDNSEIVNAFVMLAHDLNLDVVAEGVETDAQRRRLKALACEFGQGFYYSKAVDSNAAEELACAAGGVLGLLNTGAHQGQGWYIWTSRRPPPSSEAAGAAGCGLNGQRRIAAMASPAATPAKLAVASVRFGSRWMKVRFWAHSVPIARNSPAAATTTQRCREWVARIQLHAKPI